MLSTVVLSLIPVKRSHSAAAQGGMQASLGNSKMSAYNGAKSAININLPRYYGMETNPKITFRLIYNNTVKESSKNVNVGYVPQAYYKQNEINAVMNKVYKIEIERWTNKAVSVLSSPKGRAVQSLKPNSYLRIISKNDT